MVSLDMINEEAQEVLKINNKKKAGLIWFITEIIQIIILVMGAITLLWLYAPFSLVVKFIIIVLAMIIVYDIFKSFVYVRWILWKESISEDGGL